MLNAKRTWRKLKITWGHFLGCMGAADGSDGTDSTAEQNQGQAVHRGHQVTCQRQAWSMLAGKMGSREQERSQWGPRTLMKEAEMGESPFLYWLRGFCSGRDP